MFRCTAGWSLVLALVVSTGPALAAEPLDVFPDSVGVVFRFASVDKIVGGFNEMTAALGPNAAAAGPGFESGLAEMLAVQDLSVVDRTAPAFAAAFPLLQERQPFAALVTAPDENKLKRAVLRAPADAELVIQPTDFGFEKITHGDRTWFFRRAGDQILYTGSEQVARLMPADSSAHTPLSGIVEARAAELLNEGDAAAFVNLARLTEVFSDQIQQGRKQTIDGIEALPDQALGGSGADPKAIRKLYIDLANVGFDAAGDALWACGRVDFSADGADAAGFLAVKEASGTDVLLAGSPAVAFETLGLLPAGASAYFGLQWNYEQLGKWTNEWLALAYPGGDEDKQQKAKAAAEAMASAGAGAVVSGFSMPSGDRGMVTTLLQQADNIEALRQANRDYQQAIGQIETPLFKQMTDYKPAAETYKQWQIDLLVQQITLPESNDLGMQIAQAFMKKLFGGDTIETRITSVEGMMVQATSNDPKHIQQVLDGLESGEAVLGLEEHFAATRDHLGETANIIVMMNLPQIFVDGIRMVRDIPPFNAVLAQAPLNLGQPAVSYTGLSVGTEPQGVRLRVFVPVGQPKGIMQVFGQ